MRIVSLEILRFIAALWVVAAHTVGFIESRGVSVPMKEFFQAGGLGVDLFFVLSGFVMTVSIWGKRKNPWSFLGARIRRIVPAYWIVSIVTMFVIFLAQANGLSSESYPPVSIEWVVSSIFFFSQSTSYGGPLVYVGWSLEYEFLFYISMAVSLMLARSTWLRLAITGILVVSAVYIFPWISEQAFEFCVGVVVAIVFKKLTLPTLVNWTLVFSAIGLATLFFHLPSDVGRWIGLGIPFGMLVLGAAGIRISQHSLWHLLGGASYSVYLVQVLTIPLVLHPIMDLLSMPIHGFLLFCLTLLATQATGVAFHVFVDEPLRKWITEKTAFGEN